MINPVGLTQIGPELKCSSCCGFKVSWVDALVYRRPSTCGDGFLQREVGVAAKGTRLGNDDLWQCVVFVPNRVAWVSYSSKVFWHLVGLTFLVVISYILFQTNQCI